MDKRQIKTPYNTGLAKVAVQFSADTFVVKTPPSQSGKTMCRHSAAHREADSTAMNH
ncbi:MAG TPA: hypothetical protein PLW09_11360 [Candidatus Kapabacteria bacterium]|nr:hypothetical protein [Candidatus Kapabacteria bacterium]